MNIHNISHRLILLNIAMNIHRIYKGFAFLAKPEKRSFSLVLVEGKKSYLWSR